MARSPRHARLVRGTAPATKEYRITDPHHRPDLNGEFAGAKVVRRGNDQFVTLTAAQAQFYLDQLVIEPAG